MLRSSTNTPFVDNRTPTPDQANAAYLNQVGDEVNANTAAQASTAATVAGHTSTLSSHTSTLSTHTSQIAANTAAIAALPTGGSPVTTASFAPATLVTASETITANNNDTTVPTSAAVAALVAGIPGATGVTTSSFNPAALVTASETIVANNNDTTIPTCAAVAAAIAAAPGTFAAAPPSIAVHPDAGSGGLATVVEGNRAAFRVVVTSGSDPDGGTLAVATFSPGFTAPPFVVAGGRDNVSGAAQPFAASTTSTVSLHVCNAMTPYTTYTFDMIVMGT